MSIILVSLRTTYLGKHERGGKVSNHRHDESLFAACLRSEPHAVHMTGYQLLFSINPIYILSRFLGALRMMLSTRNRSCHMVSHTQSLCRWQESSHLTSAASLAEDTTARFNL